MDSLGEYPPRAEGMFDRLWSVEPSQWGEEEVKQWLRLLEIHPSIQDVLLEGGIVNGKRLLATTEPELMSHNISMGLASIIVGSVRQLKTGLKPRFISAHPYDWPFNGDLRPENTSLIIMNMQVDFCDKQGYFGAMYPEAVERNRVIIPRIKTLLETFRARGYVVMWVREGHRPDLSDLPANKRWRSVRAAAGIGDINSTGAKFLIRGQPGWNFIPELVPLENEPIIEKPGKGAFYATDLDIILRQREIANLVLCGVTTDVGVSTTMRDANDRGYECLLLVDCCAAATPQLHAAAVQSIQESGGIFGCVSTSQELIKVIGQ